MNKINKISSIRWNDPELFEHAHAYAEMHHEKMNSLIMNALSEYLKDKAGQVSRLKAQTAAFSEDTSQTKAWSQGQDTRGWE